MCDGENKRENKRENYDDIINHPHHVSARHPRMPVSDRAAQFSPFAALTGYGDVIEETARLTDRRPELSEAQKEVLDVRLRMAVGFPGVRPVVAITYFVPDRKKEGGSCHTISGRIAQIDDHQRTVVLEDQTRIDMDCILSIDGAIYSGADDAGSIGEGIGWG